MLRTRKALLCALWLLATTLTGCAPAPALKYLSVEVAMPERWTVGEHSAMVIALRNSGAQPLTVQDVDLGRSLLDAFNIIAVTPQPLAADVRLRDYCIMHLGLEVPAQSVREVTVLLEAVKPGSYSGDVDAGLDAFHVVTVRVSARIEEPVARPPVGPAEPLVPSLSVPAPPVPSTTAPVPPAAGATTPRPPNSTAPALANPSPPPAVPSGHAGGSPPGQTPLMPDRQSPRP